MSATRQFLKASAITLGGFIIPWKQGMANTSLSLDPGGISKFADPLPIPATLKATGNS